MANFIFDLDMTLIDTSSLSEWRRMNLWPQVQKNINLAKPFRSNSGIAPHEIPASLKKAGHRISIVTSSPGWYAKELIGSFGIEVDSLVTHESTTDHKPDSEPLLHALKELDADPADSYYIGDDGIDVEAAYHASVKSIGVAWGINRFDEISSTAPDILIHKPETLMQVDKLERRGYYAEMSSAGKDCIRYKGAVLPCDRGPLHERFSLGRYFATADPRHAECALAGAILSLKTDDEQAAVFGVALRMFLQHQAEPPDYIVGVPPKPDQSRNRFEQVIAHALEEAEEEPRVDLGALERVKDAPDYKQLGPLEREAALDGAFRATKSLSGVVLLVDDVMTTGATAESCVKALLAAGAERVRVVAFAKDQRAFVHKQCPQCGRSMRIRTNPATNVKFWGCSGYPESCTNTEDF